MSETNQWWGYKHISGSYQAKRYFGTQDIKEALESTFVEHVIGPFDAKNRNHAIRIVKKKTK